MELSAALRKLAEHRRRRDMLQGLAQSPVEFMAGLLSTQVCGVWMGCGFSTLVVQKGGNAAGVWVAVRLHRHDITLIEGRSSNTRAFYQ